MKSVEIDFMPISRPRPWMWWCVGALVFIGAVILGISSLQRSEEMKLRLERNRLEEDAVLPKNAPAPISKAASYEASARQMLEERGAAWPARLAALEVTEVPGIQIVAVDIAPTENRIRVEVQINDMSSLVMYLDQLNLGESETVWSLEQMQAASAEPNGPSTAFVQGRLRN